MFIGNINGIMPKPFIRGEFISFGRALFKQCPKKNEDLEKKTGSGIVIQSKLCTSCSKRVGDLQGYST